MWIGGTCAWCYRRQVMNCDDQAGDQLELSGGPVPSCCESPLGIEQQLHSLIAVPVLLEPPSDHGQSRTWIGVSVILLTALNRRYRSGSSRTSTS